MILRLGRYLQLGLLISCAGFLCAQDQIVQEYKEYAEVIKGDILPRMQLVKDRTEYTRGLLNKRRSAVDSEIKKTLGRESQDAFWKRTRPIDEEWMNVNIAYQKDPDNKKLFEKKKKLDVNPDLNKRFRLGHLVHAKDVIEQDMNTQRYLLDKFNARLQKPDEYMAAMNKKTFTEPGNMPRRDPAPYLLDSVEYYEKGIGDLGNDPMENWFDENYGYTGRRTISQIPAVATEFDRAVQYSMERVDDVLAKEYHMPHDWLYKKLGLEEANKAASGGPMFSPIERTLSQRVAAYVAPRMQQVGSWWNRFTSNWFVRNPNRFSSMRPVKMPKLGQPRIVGKPITNIESYELFKPSK